jgi:L-lysine exporter family protein LysE/ArgO
MPAQLHLFPFLVLVKGFLLGAGLIIVLGPQNLFLLQQGLRRRHLFLTPLLCTLCDLVLITLGVGGVGAAIAGDERLLTAITLGGAAFLLGYGVRSLRSVWYTQPATIPEPTAITPLSLKGTILATLSFSLLNPSAYLDTVLMIGTAGSQFPIDERVVFGAGALLASALWFFSLTYGASRLGPLLHRPAAWRMFDLVNGCLMVGIAGSLCVTHSVWR